MLAILATPTVTLAEAEISVPKLASLYSQAIGEQVDVLPTIERRAVAVFVRNEPWDHVISLAGEAGGFRLARVKDRLRIEATRRFDLVSLQNDLARRLRRYAVPPSDVASGYARHLALDAALDRERALPKRDPERIAELKRALDEVSNVSSPQRLLLARFLKRGGTVPLGKTILLRFGDYVSDREFSVYDYAGDGPPTPRFAALRCEDSTVEIALEGDRSLDLWRTYSAQLEVGSQEEPSKATRAALAEMNWSLAPAPSIGPLGGYTIGDVLGWMHRLTGRPAVGAAPRMGLPRLEDNLVPALLTGPIRISVCDGAFLAITAFGDGLWPEDMKRVESLKNPTLVELADVCAEASPIWDALLAREYGSIASRFRFEISSSLPVLRMLGGASPMFLARLRNEERIAISSLDAASSSAINSVLIDDATPDQAIRRVVNNALAITPAFSEAKVTVFTSASGWETSIDNGSLAQYPEARRQLPAEFVFEAPGVSERFWMTVGDDSDQDAAAASITRLTGSKGPLKH